MNVAFLNENTLGHTSYLPRFIEAFRQRPELGVVPHQIDVLPLPAQLRRLGDTSVRGLRKVGLDFHAYRWRLAASRHAREQLDRLRSRLPVDAVVVNTQSVGLALADLPACLPVWVALDATFEQLAGSPWFAPNRVAGWLLPLTLHSLRRRERGLFARADHFLPWSELPARSLQSDYGIPANRITILPPSMVPPPRRDVRPMNPRPQILFVGTHFDRKGGPLLLNVFRRYFADRCDLHLLTATDISPEPHVFVHHSVQAGSGDWMRRWREADVFVFPSTLETFGIVLVEAIAFEVPVVASGAGAARFVLCDGASGWLVEPLGAELLAAAIEAVLSDPAAASERVRRGRAHFESNFNLGNNAENLCRILQRACDTQLNRTYPHAMESTGSSPR